MRTWFEGNVSQRFVGGLLMASVALGGMVQAQEKDKAKTGKGKEEAAGKPAKTKAAVPEDLVGNEHIREEFGVNEFTTPSIRKIFDQLDAWARCPMTSSNARSVTRHHRIACSSLSGWVC
ncbi:hypothetical protein [Verrucomicrobium spinosum]|uniref:hypothetical protein n=1 Tax=Verrucomicrobium spinosum TaxID=2736 RepID=UPI0012E1A3C9|nr:hypothetical protein [Verrucomicrobium spinosum]